jgi:putative toxin-antitoxin system antitoxin component (TIGR02293 family)
MNMAERQHTAHAPKGRSKGGKAHGAGEPRSQHYERQAGGISTVSSAAGDAMIAAVGALVIGKMFGGAAPEQPTNAAPGQNVLAELAQRTGMSQREVMSRIATALPEVVNHMTPNARMPTLADLEKGPGFLDEMRSVMSEIANSTSEVTEADLKWRAGYFDYVSTLLGGRSVLGSSIESELDAHELLRRGLPREALSTLVENLHVISVNEASEALGVSVRTLQRHKHGSHGPVVRLDVPQSGRAWRFAEILAKATRVLGSQEEAEQWLKRPAIGLDRQRPVDLLTTPAGAKLVETYLGRLEYGVYT